MFAVISDVHGNLEALERVLEDIKEKGISDIFFLGDAVGYGPNPKEVLEILKGTCKVLIAGNHDRAVVEPGLDPYFNEIAREALVWTRDILDEREKRLLKALPLYYSLQYDDIDILFVHATPRYPEEWNYLMTLRDAELNFYYFKERLCFIGHSHSPFIVEKSKEGELTVRKERPCFLRDTSRYIINAGSVGQPRDGDPRACYVIFNGKEIEFIRLQYNIGLTQKKMKEAGLPLPLIERLDKGV